MRWINFGCCHNHFRGHLKDDLIDKKIVNLCLIFLKMSIFNIVHFCIYICGNFFSIKFLAFDKIPAYHQKFQNPCEIPPNLNCYL